MIPGVPIELQIALLALGGVMLTAVGTLGGVWLSTRAQRRAAEVQAAANKKDAENTLIDQLQEELAEHRRAQEARATAQDARMNRLETHNDGYRAHIHDLRAHIWDGKPPPPPAWPDNLPR